MWGAHGHPISPPDICRWCSPGKTGCPLLGVKRTSRGLVTMSAFDPNVWSGRALQVDFAELAVSGLASMYPASDWSVLCSGPLWISARVRSH